MSAFSDRNPIGKVLGSLGWPMIIGLAGCSMFYVLIFEGPLNTPEMHRYFASHPVSYVEVVMFMVGAAALALKFGDLLLQQRGMHRLALPSLEDFQDAGEASEEMSNQLAKSPSHVRESYLGNRLREALSFMRRKGSAAGLDEELKYLSEADAIRQQDSYALVRIIIWATPMLGFLGTVIGITQTLGGLDPTELANSAETAMEGFLGGLYIAFDTTTVALALSIVLMFVQFFVDRLESALLTNVDERTTTELLDRFDEHGFRSDPNLVAIDRMSVAVAKTAEQLVQKQTDLWQNTIETSNQKWCEMLDSSGAEMREALTSSLDKSLANHADRLAELGKQADDQVSSRWEQWQTALSSNARLLHSQQQEMVRQGEILNQVVKGTGEIVTLEKALNDNLNHLSGAKNFEDTVMSLSAAIHLLNTRISDVPAGEKAIELDKPQTQDRAA